jgi:hypothetical protein
MEGWKSTIYFVFVNKKRTSLIQLATSLVTNKNTNTHLTMQQNNQQWQGEQIIGMAAMPFC